jgi:hypothetical protein
MAKMTLLAIVQDILSDMDSDNVNSINDTVESQQVAQIVKTTYEEIVANREWDHLKEMVQLTASGDSNYPTHMSISDGYQKIYWIKYNKEQTGDTRVKYEDVEYLDPKEFLDIVMSRNEDSSNITKISDYSGVDLLIQTDAAPSYWTSFDDENIVFDSYDSSVDTTVQQSKTQVYALKEATWSALDTFTPDLPSKAFPFLVSEAKSTCFNSLRQFPNAKEEQKARRQRTWLAREKWRTNGGIKFPNYGRK